MNPLVSIIIPTYNRAHLIGETLDSILAQTYTRWECIVVDDGSTDGSETVLRAYSERDPRITYYHRPADRPRGGNAARNYGFEKSVGDYIQWFDSDDLMSPNKLELSVQELVASNLDMVVSKRKTFNKPDLDEYQYDYSSEDITFKAYAMGPVNWFTTDIMVRRDIASKVAFNETLRAGQEYNFSCKLLLFVEKVKKLDAVTTLRRFHEASIGHQRKEDFHHYLETKFYSHWQTYLEVKEIKNVPAFNRYSLRKCVITYCDPKARFQLPNNFMAALKEVFGLRAYYLYLAKISGRWLHRPYYFYNKLS